MYQRVKQTFSKQTSLRYFAALVLCPFGSFALEKVIDFEECLIVLIIIETDIFPKVSINRKASKNAKLRRGAQQKEIFLDDENYKLFAMRLMPSLRSGTLKFISNASFRLLNLR